MEKLNLPIVTKHIPDAKSLSMGDYLEFVKFHLKYTFDRKAYLERKKTLAVNVMFSLK